MNCSPSRSSRPATKAVRTYEVIGKVASNTMAATVISAVLVGGYVLFGMFSKPPGAAEITTDSTIGETQLVAALHPDVTASDEPRVQREERRIDRRCRRDIGGCARSERGKRRFHRPFRTGPGIRLIQSGGSILSALRNRQFRPRHRSVSRRRFRPAFATLAPPKPTTDSRRAKIATPAPRKPLPILPPVASAPPPDRRMPITAALTP